MSPDSDAKATSTLASGTRKAPGLTPALASLGDARPVQSAPHDDRTGDSPVAPVTPRDMTLTWMPTREAFLVADSVLGLGGRSIPGHEMQWAVVVDGKVFKVPDEGILLGRSSEPLGNLLQHSEISRRHAEVSKARGGIGVVDLGSSNGTVIVRDGAPFAVGAEIVLLEEGDVLMTGTDVLIAEIEATDRGGSR